MSPTRRVWRSRMLAITSPVSDELSHVLPACRQPDMCFHAQCILHPAHAERPKKFYAVCTPKQRPHPLYSSRAPRASAVAQVLILTTPVTCSQLRCPADATAGCASALRYPHGPTGECGEEEEGNVPTLDARAPSASEKVHWRPTAAYTRIRGPEYMQVALLADRVSVG